jgi:hypothetical protein
VKGTILICLGEKRKKKKRKKKNFNYVMALYFFNITCFCICQFLYHAIGGYVPFLALISYFVPPPKFIKHKKNPIFVQKMANL